MGLREEIEALPKGWNFVLVEGKGDTKKAYQQNWRNLKQDAGKISELLKDPVNKRRASMVGVVLGEASGSLLAVDVDGQAASNLLKERFGIE